MRRWMPLSPPPSPACCLSLLLALLLAACGRQAPEAPGTAAPAPAPAGDVADAAGGNEEAPAPAGSAAPGPGEVPRAFLCRGNEPFWALDAGDGEGLFKQPEGELPLDGELRALAGGAWRFRGAPVDGPGELVEALISPGQCFDSMADGPAQPWSAVVNWPGGQGQGCCRAEFGLDMANAPVHEPLAKPEQDWSRWLPELAAPLERCAFDAGVATEAATRAWPMNHGKTGVRLRDSGGERFDCVVDAGTGVIESVQPVMAGDPLPGEGAPEWRPAREDAPMLHCGRVERVIGPDGRLQGWLYYRDGCP